VTKIEHAPEGLVVRVRPEGIARFGGALFLSVWLCFWALGESIVLGVLANGVSVLVTGHEFSGRPRALELVPALAVGGFFVVWISFWTFGGVMAIAELLRLVSSEEALVIDPGSVIIRRRRGPFTTSRTIARAEVSRVRVSPRDRMLVLDTRRRSFDGVHVVTPADEQQVLFAVRKELGLGAAPRGEGALPEGWEETLTPEGDRVLVRDTRARRKQALGLTLVAAAFWAIALGLAWTSMTRRLPVTPAVVLTILAALIALWAYWLEVGRQEIKLGGERAYVRRRWRGKVRDLFVADKLELRLSTDSDGDVWYRLEAINSGAFDPHPRRSKDRRTLSSAMNDPFEPEALGRWLAARTGMPFIEP
jgi:hypothetical protein